MLERPPIRVVLLGFGPVGARFVDEILPGVRARSIALTVIGAEREAAYNRVLLAEYAVGRADRARLDLTDHAVAAQAGVIFRLGETVTSINRIRQDVSVDTGATVAYDRLVIATGARANIPTLAGLETSRVGFGGFIDIAAARLPQGIEVMRDLHDAEVARAAIAEGARVIVLGAGVLGMELALSAREVGAKVVVMYHGSVPMERNLDSGGGRVLARAAERAGVQMLKHSRAESVLLRTTDDGRRVFDALICADGKQMSGDLLLLSCGVGARTELAVRAGLEVGRGVLVDEELRSWTDPDIFAIGDCAHVAPRPEQPGVEAVAGAPAGLIGPGWRQADWLARTLVAEASGARRPELLRAEKRSVVMLKAEGVNVVSAGQITAEPWGDDALEVTQWVDPARGRYVKMVAREGVLDGFVCAGMPRLGAELTLLFERGSSLPDDPADLLHLDGAVASHQDSSAIAVDDTVCWCNGVSAGAISDCVAEGARTVEQVSAATRAGTGCGGCKGRIAQLLASPLPSSRVEA